MATSHLSRVTDHLRRTLLPCDGGDRTDGQLLECFIERHDEAAFAALVRRHGPLVLGVCRRVLGHVHDAEDAFQATFLVLVRRAASLSRRELLGNWLYGVAYRTALEARGRNARRRTHERQVDALPQPATESKAEDTELAAVLDQELSGLPDKYRVPIVLCDLEGRSRKEVARRLEVPEGTLSSRLATARTLLADRLTRRGMALSAGALALPAQAAACGIGPSLVGVTVKAAAGAVAGQVAAGFSPVAVVLARGVLHDMFLSKVKMVAAMVLAFGLAGTGAGTLTHRALADRPADPAVVAVNDNPAEPPADQPQNRERERPGADEGKGGAQEKENDKRDKGKGKAAGEMVTLTGTVEKRVAQRKRDDGTSTNVTLYYLIEANGNKVELPRPRRTEAGKLLDRFELEDYVGKKVTLSGRGTLVRQSEKANAPRRVVRMLTITEMQQKD